MDATTKNAAEPKRSRDIHYYRQRYKNRVFETLVEFFNEEAAKRGITRKEIARLLQKDPAQITRWLSSPGNLTLESVSDLLLALDAEAEPGKIVRFSERPKPNYAHPLIARIFGVTSQPTSSSPSVEAAARNKLSSTSSSTSGPWNKLTNVS